MDVGTTDLGVVFIHGLFSSEKTWDPLARLLESDEELASVTVRRFGYASPKLRRFRPDRRIADYRDLTDGLKTFLHYEAAGHDRLVLVAHSQGGLIVQRYLARMINSGLGQGADRPVRPDRAGVAAARPPVPSPPRTHFRRDAGHPPPPDGPEPPRPRPPHRRHPRPTRRPPAQATAPAPQTHHREHHLGHRPRPARPVPLTDRLPLPHRREPVRALIKQVRPLLEDHGHRPEPIPARLIDPSDLASYVMHATSQASEHDTPH